MTPAVADNPDANPPVPDVTVIQATGATFQTNNAKLYVPVVTFSINDNINFLENIKLGSKEQFIGTNIDLNQQNRLKKESRLPNLSNI